MKNIIRNICDLFIGILCISTVVTGYYKDFTYMGEYCFVSGIFVGAFFLFSFFYKLFTKKELPVWLYFNCMITLLIIFIATVVIKLNLEGAFWFIHIINPIIVFLYWCFFCNHQVITNPAKIVTVVVFPLCYLIFAFVIEKISGSFPFPAGMIFEMGSISYIIGAIVALLVAFLVIGYVLHFINFYFHIYKNSY